MPRSFRGGRPRPGYAGFAIFAASTLALLCASAAGQATAQPADALTPDRQREILRQALGAFDEAVSVARDNRERAQELYRKSAAAFETLVAGGIRNAALEYNLGNAYFRLGELGRAVLHYRRAQRLDPTDAALLANLKYARNRVEPYVQPTGTQRLVRRLTFWANHTSIQSRFWLAAVASAIGWLGLMVRLRWRSRPLAALACVAIVIGWVNAGSAGWQLHDEAGHAPAVIVGGERVLRLGRGEGYDPALTQPLGPGVELRVCEERGEWLQVELLDGKTGWLPAAAVERV